MENINPEKFIAKAKQKIKDYDNSYDGKLTKEEGEAALEKIKTEISALQEKMYAQGSQSLLIIFQAMDAAGKDSAIEHVMSELNPQGCQVYSFKTPNNEEYKHDFLWRHYKALPEKGKIGIHNRSHYENVLVCKVHPAYVLNEQLPGYKDVKKMDDNFWEMRYQSIKNFEQHLHENGTTIVKIFLNVSKAEQKQRFLDRINDQAKHWKFAAGDLKERALWDDYMKAYETAFDETSTKANPWYVVPADKKWYARLVISEIVLSTMQAMQLEFPTLSKEEVDELADCKKQLLAEK